MGSPSSKNAIAAAAVTTVATQGVSLCERRARNLGNTASSASCDNVREAPASGCSVPWNILNVMKPTAIAFASEPTSGANVGPSSSARSRPSASGPRTPSQMTGSATKYSPAKAALTNIARGTLRVGSTVSPTWHPAASNAGAANPTKYSPAIKDVKLPKAPENGVVK